MKTGLDNKRNLMILSLLGVVMVGAVVYFVTNVFGGGSAAPAAPQTAATPARQAAGAPANAGGHAAEKIPSLASLDPTLHPELMSGAEALEYSGKGRNIFSMESAPVEIPKAAAPIRPVAPPPVIAQGPPPPPPIALKFFGYEANNGAKKAFLLKGDDVFIASEGDVVDHHYKVVKITPLSIQVTDLLYNNTQTLPLSQS